MEIHEDRVFEIKVSMSEAYTLLRALQAAYLHLHDSEDQADREDAKRMQEMETDFSLVVKS